MVEPGTLLLLLIGLTAALVGLVVVRPQVADTRGGKILSFVSFFLLPMLCAAVGTSEHLERSKQTAFCLSCHEMEPYGKSLMANDASFLAAAHFQNQRVPLKQACYSCHTDYVLYGGVRDKWRGLRHLYAHYSAPAGTPIRLYQPYNNRECLHCHAGARSFEEGAVHNADPELIPAVKSGKLSCLSAGCHDVVHNVAALDKVEMWKGQ